jgi:DNA-binding PadR family transcriptional regulator
MGQHVLKWNQALPAEVSDEKVYTVLNKGRELLKRLSGDAPDLQFRHKVEEKEATIGGPLGQKIRVVYITLFARFEKPDFMLPPETLGLLQQHRMQVQHREVFEAAAKAMAEQRKEMERAVKEAKAAMPESVRQLPGVETVPAHTVSPSQMVLTDEDIARQANQPAGVSVFDGPMFPTSDEEVQ